MGIHGRDYNAPPCRMFLKVPRRRGPIRRRRSTRMVRPMRASSRASRPASSRTSR
ncbi:hypothetical protein BURCENBC7_AP7423, partial [Burkholderia cenocepacia BC7]